MNAPQPNPVAKFSEAVAIEGAEVFRSGVHRGKEYTNADLDDMVENFERFSSPRAEKVLLRVPGVFGHEERQEALERSDLPAAAWPSKLYRDGDVLKADFPPLNPEVARLIAGKAYDTVSAEVYDRPPDGIPGQGRMLRRIAFLGGDIPEVKGLKSLSECLVPDVHSEARVRRVRPGELTVRKVKALPGGAFAVFSEVVKHAEPRNRRPDVGERVRSNRGGHPMTVIEPADTTPAGQSRVRVAPGPIGEVNVRDAEMKDEAGQPYGPQTPTKNAEGDPPAGSARAALRGVRASQQLANRSGRRPPMTDDQLGRQMRQSVPLTSEEAAREEAEEADDHAEPKPSPRERRVWGGTNAAAALERRNREGRERGRALNLPAEQEASAVEAAAVAARQHDEGGAKPKATPRPPETRESQVIRAETAAQVAAGQERLDRSRKVAKPDPEVGFAEGYFAEGAKAPTSQEFAEPRTPKPGDEVETPSGRREVVRDSANGVSAVGDRGSLIANDRLRDVKQNKPYPHDEATRPEASLSAAHRPRKPLEIEVDGRKVTRKSTPPGWKTKHDADLPSEEVAWNPDMEADGVAIHDRKTRAEAAAAHAETVAEEPDDDGQPLEAGDEYVIGDKGKSLSAIHGSAALEGGRDADGWIAGRAQGGIVGGRINANPTPGTSQSRVVRTRRNSDFPPEEQYAEPEQPRRRRPPGEVAVEMPAGAEQVADAVLPAGRPTTAQASPAADDRPARKRRADYFAEGRKEATAQVFAEPRHRKPLEGERVHEDNRLARDIRRNLTVSGPPDGGEPAGAGGSWVRYGPGDAGVTSANDSDLKDEAGQPYGPQRHAEPGPGHDRPRASASPAPAGSDAVAAGSRSLASQRDANGRLYDAAGGTVPALQDMRRDAPRGYAEKGRSKNPGPGNGQRRASGVWTADAPPPDPSEREIIQDDANGRLHGLSIHENQRIARQERGEDPPDATDHAENPMQKEELLAAIADLGMDTAPFEQLPEEAIAEVLRALDGTGRADRPDEPEPEPEPEMKDDEPEQFEEDCDDDDDEKKKRKKDDEEDSPAVPFSEKAMAALVAKAVADALAAERAAAKAEIDRYAEASQGRTQSALAAAKKAMVDAFVERLDLQGRLPPAEKESVRGRLLRADNTAKVVKYRENGRTESLTEFEAQVRELESRPTLFAERMRAPARGEELADAEEQKVADHFDSFSERYQKLGQTRDKFLGAYRAEKKMNAALTADRFLNR